jgi:hypothetical protein
MLNDWVMSTVYSHPALVSEQGFITAQTISCTPTARDGGTRDYPFAGLVRCATCGRCLEAHRVHDRPGYRCRHGRTSAAPLRTSTARSVYVRQDYLVAAITSQLSLTLASDIDSDHAAQAVASQLRTRQLVVTCGPGGNIGPIATGPPIQNGGG